MSNKTDYEAWELSPGYDVVHALVIDRGDNTAANRLTITDKLLVDIAYAATYPAPIHGILSEIQTTERRDGKSTYADILIGNANGEFDDLLTDSNLFKKPFTMYRGSTSWSLATTVYPEIFLPIFVGEIAGVKHGPGVVTLKIRPRSYKMEGLIGGFDASIETGDAEPPLVIGKAFNVEAVLVDATPTDKYRVNSIETDGIKRLPNLVSRFAVRDKGALLVYPYTATTDWDFTDEADGEFRGMFTLTATPDGQVTVDVNYNSFSSQQVDQRVGANIAWLLANYATDDYPTLTSREVETTIYDYRGAFSFGKSDERFYTQYDDGRLQQYNMTAGDFSTAVRQASEYLVLGGTTLNRGGARFSDDGLTVWIMNASKQFHQATLDVAWELGANTQNFVGSPNTYFPTELNSDAIQDYLISDDGAGNHRVFYLTTSGIIYKGGAFTAEIIPNGINELTKIHDLRDYDGAAPFSGGKYVSMDWDSTRTKLYLMAAGVRTVFQFDILTAGDLTDLRPTNRGFIIPTGGMIEGLDSPQFFRMGADGNRFYLLENPDGFDKDMKHLEYGGITNGDLPILLFRHNQDSAHIFLEGGVAYPGATQLSTVIKDLLTIWDSPYTIDKNGAICAVQLKDPEYTPEVWETIYPITLGDFYGSRGEHVAHVKTDRAKGKFTVYYDKNFTIQRESDLAGSVSQDDIGLYGSPHKETSAEATLTDYIDPEEIILDSYIAGITDAETVRDELKALREVERAHYRLNIRLSATSLLTDFGLGSIIQIEDDILHPDFSAADKAQVTGRKVNWTKNLQQLTVFK